MLKGYTALSRQILTQYLKKLSKENTQLKFISGTSLVTEQIRIHLPVQGTRVRALVREDPTCRGATRPVRHNY